jgi:hypothetical protein
MQDLERATERMAADDAKALAKKSEVQATAAK